MVVKESYNSPDIYVSLDRLCDVLTDFKFDVEQMMNKTDDISSQKKLFGTSDQLFAYDEDIKLLTTEMKEILERFRQISGIDDD